MKSFDKILQLANKFEFKISQAQSMQGAQAADIEEALKKAGVWIEQNDIGPLLNNAKVPEDVSLSISIIVDHGLIVKFNVNSQPPSPSAKTLEKILNANYSGKMSQALKNAKLSVTDTVTAKIAEFAWLYKI